MNQLELAKKMALLESTNDQLLAEIGYVDRLMREVGFTEGLQTVKYTAEEIYNEELYDQ